MSVNAIHGGSGQQVQDEVLSLIRTRSQRAMPGRQAAESEPTAVAAAGAAVHPDDAVDRINTSLQALGTDLHFEVDVDSHRTVVKVIDRENGEVLRQIPTEATLQIARSLDKVIGHLIDKSI